MDKKWTINIYNQVIDISQLVLRTGRNNVIYEYVLPYGKNPMYFYQDAIDVRSHKRPDTKYNNGKRPGQYQPVGDKKYFTFYNYKHDNWSDVINLSFIEDFVDKFKDVSEL